MLIPIPEKLRPLARAFSGAGVAVYAVGGLVRNTLLELPLSDIDICSRLRPEEAARLFSDAGFRAFDQGARFGTVALLLPDGEKVEHTCFRRDAYAAGGAHRPERVDFGESLTEDAFRRDFTVNALYADLNTGELLDPTGGFRDLSAGLMRATGPRPDDILGSDALRVLRLVRFSGELGFAIEPETLAAAGRNAGKLSDISAERIRAELDKILLSDARYGRSRLLDTLHRMDALRLFDGFWPELSEGRGHAQRPNVHRYEALEHYFRVCAETPPALPLRLAGLLHDVAKPRCKAQTGNYHEHDGMSAELARAMLLRLKYDRATTERAVRIIARHMYDIQGTARDSTLRTAFCAWGREGTADEIVMREADVRGCGYDTGYVCTRWRALLEQMQTDGTPFSVSELAVSGGDALMAGIPAGRAVGEALERLRLHCVTQPKDNTRERLLKLLVNNRPET